MLKIGLTGGIGSGKTTVAAVFETLGIPVYYADEAAKRLMNENSALMESIITAFGANAYNDKGLDRHYISNMVFSDRKKLHILNALVHPVTLKDADLWMNRQTALYAIKEAALIFEANLPNYFDYVIGVDAPFELRLERVMKRDAVSRNKVLERMKNQMPDDEKMKRCDFIIVNDDSRAVLPQVLKLHEQFISV